MDARGSSRECLEARSSATSAHDPASSCTSTARSSDGSSRPATASPAIAHDEPGGAGWQHLFVAIDDHSRLGFASIHPDETADSALAFLDELVGFYSSHGIRIERVLTDNGTRFKRRWAHACAAHEIAVKKTRAYRPQTNGKAERFIRTLLERWAYAYTYDTESERYSLALGARLLQRFRPHRALAGLAAKQRVNNLPGTYS